MASLHPKKGARVVLERDSVDDAGARYRVTVYEPNEISHESAAQLGSDVELAAWSSEPPEWTRVFVDRLLRTLAKKHAAGTWPRKLTRWRDER